jgi:lysophospholipase L1-like esterase
VGGTKSIDGVSLIPLLLPNHSDAQYFLIEYGTNDAVTPVPSGSGLHPGDAGYPGTFKDNMQRIITAVKNAGKLPCLGKVPYSNGQYLARNTLYQGYNQVIDQLVAENNITVIPPDFYTWFQNHQDQLYSDGLHPNGIGYQSMANLWQAALP